MSYNRYVSLGVNSVRVNVSMHPLGAGLSLVGREATAHKSQSPIQLTVSQEGV